VKASNSDSLQAAQFGDRIPVGGGGRRFSSPGTQTASYAVGTGSQLRVKLPGRGINHPPRLTAKVELSLICHLLALLGAHHILYVSRIRVKINLTFRGQCIVIYSYNKIQQHALISQIYFWNVILNVSDRFSAHHQEPNPVYTAIGIFPKGIRIPLASSQHNLYDIYLLMCIQYLDS
jgi:hypothetical protein